VDGLYVIESVYVQLRQVGELCFHACCYHWLTFPHPHRH
jgi:hypothetical protein